MIHWPSSKINSCPPNFMVTGPPSRRRLSTENAVSSSCEILGKEPPFRLTGLRGVLNEDLENMGIPNATTFPVQLLSANLVGCLSFRGCRGYRSNCTNSQKNCSKKWRRPCNRCYCC